MEIPELPRRTYILGGSLLGVLMLFFLVRRARAKTKAIEAPAKAPVGVKPAPKPPTQQQLAYRAPGSAPSLDIRRPAPVTMPRPPRPRGPSKAWTKAQAEFKKFQDIEKLSPKERGKARREALIAQGIKPGSTVPGPMNLPPPWKCPTGYGWIHNQKKFPHGRWSCKQGVVTQRPKPKTPAELKAAREVRKAQRATA
jgi:hypothetical protein